MALTFETDRELIYRTNFNLISRLLGRLDGEIFPVMCMQAAPRSMGTTHPGRMRMSRLLQTATIPCPKSRQPT